MTRLEVLAILIARAGPFMAKAGWSVLVEELNTDLDEPMRRGWIDTGLDLGVETTVNDVLLLSHTYSTLAEFLDRAEYATFQMIQTRRKTPSIQITGAIQTYDSDLLRQINAILARMRTDIEQRWGLPKNDGTSGLVYWFTQSTPRDDVFDPPYGDE
jgi:hypothetical protein